MQSITEIVMRDDGEDSVKTSELSKQATEKAQSKVKAKFRILGVMKSLKAKGGDTIAESKKAHRLHVLGDGLGVVCINCLYVNRKPIKKH